MKIAKLKIDNFFMKALFLTSIITILLAPTFAIAQDYVPLAPIPGYVEPGPANLTNYLKGIYQFGVAAAGILAVLMLVWGGFKYATSEAISGKGEGKEIINNVVWGGAIVLGSFLLLYTINPKLIDVGLAISNLKSVTKTPPPELSYSAFLDQMLTRVQATSKKAQDVKKDSDAKRLERGQLQQAIDEGNYDDDLELAEIQSRINELNREIDYLDKAEVDVRAYENAVDKIVTDSKNMIDCLNGQGPCFYYVNNGAVSKTIRNILYGAAGRPADILSKDQAEAEKFLQGTRDFIAKEIPKLNAAGLTERAVDLQNKLNGMTTAFEFYKQCPGAKAIPNGWRPGNTNCS